LSSLFGGEASSLNAAAEAPTTPQGSAASNATPSAAPATDVKGLIAEAGKDFDEYQKLTAQGKLGEAGQKLEELKGVLAKLQSAK
jgi:hypothetical protein